MVPLIENFQIQTINSTFYAAPEMRAYQKLYELFWMSSGAVREKERGRVGSRGEERLGMRERERGGGCRTERMQGKNSFHLVSLDCLEVKQIRKSQEVIRKFPRAALMLLSL